jgi:hypothetical protein
MPGEPLVNAIVEVYTVIGIDSKEKRRQPSRPPQELKRAITLLPFSFYSPLTTGIVGRNGPSGN